MTQLPTLELQHIDIGYRTGGRCRVVLSDVTASLQGGQLVCLVGRNGCGKSTLLRTAAGLQEPLNEGRILVDGVPMGDLSPIDLARRIGLVTTARPELTHTTVRELVTYGRLPYTGALGRPTATDRREAERALEQTGITALADRRLTTLSDGEQQKAMVAKTLAQGTDFILLDEPSAFLDYAGRRTLMRLLQYLAHDEGKAILLSTHDVELVRLYADRVWWAADQRLQIMPPAEFDPEVAYGN
jgi:iron complex transport system ATP-binding protein